LPQTAPAIFEAPLEAKREAGNPRGHEAAIDAAKKAIETPEEALAMLAPGGEKEADAVRMSAPSTVLSRDHPRLSTMRRPPTPRRARPFGMSAASGRSSSNSIGSANCSRPRQ